MIKKELQKAIFDVTDQRWPEAKIKKEDIEMSYPPEGMGDYSCNVAMKLAKILGKNPKELGLEMIELLAEYTRENEYIDKVEIAGAGFLNFYLKDDHFQSLIDEINRSGSNYGQLDPEKKEKVMVEFVSANPTGPIHLGNGRGAPFGDTLASILEKAGQEVWREYYVNDFGNQIKILGHSVLKDEKAEYKGEYIEKLHKENKLTDAFEVGQWAAGKILKEIIQPSMENLGIKFNEYFSEKKLHKSGQVEAVIKILQEKKLVYEKEGAIWFRAMEFGDEKDRVIRKSTGELTYFGGDIAYHKNKFERGFDRVINVWGADHHGDVKRVLGVVEAIGHKDKLEIILTQMVRVIKDGREYKMSKRQGTYISVDDLIDEVGKDAVRFIFLMYSNNAHINFDIDLAKERSEKNPVYYVQYAHARICSILRKSQTLNSKFQTNSKSEIQKLKLLVNERELGLLKHLNKFPELIENMAEWREVHHLPAYLIRLADKFHGFYADCQVINEDDLMMTLTRLELVKATKTVLAEGLRLLGVSAPEKM
jgi:arginyl-tRNA synthetase